MVLIIGKQKHVIHPRYRMSYFLEAIFYRLDLLNNKNKVNEFSGKDIVAIKSTMLQLAQNGMLSTIQKKLIILDILKAMEVEN
jgi:hypothetical protein